MASEATTTTTVPTVVHKPKQSPAVIRWCGTLFISSCEGGKDEALEIMNQIGGCDCKYFVAGYEQAPTTGEWHYQFYCHFLKPIRFTALKSKYNGNIHWEQAKGSPCDNFAYCTKADPSFIEFGETPIDNGKRERDLWAAARQAALRGEHELIDDRIFVTHYGNLCRITKDNLKVRPTLSTGPCGIWIVGLSGFGKSHMARDVFPNYYPKLCNKWWDGYKGEPVAILEDLGLDHAGLCSHIKLWADQYGFIAENKGGAQSIRPDQFVVTSQYEINQIWNDAESQQAMYRRFEVWFMDEPRKVTRKQMRWKDGNGGETTNGTVRTFVPATPTPTVATLPLEEDEEDDLAIELANEVDFNIPRPKTPRLRRTTSMAISPLENGEKKVEVIDLT